MTKTSKVKSAERFGDTIVSPNLGDTEALKEGLESVVTANTAGITSYYETGEALQQIKSAELYKPEYSNFLRYCQDKFELSEARVKQFIRAVKVTNTVIEVIGNQEIKLTEGLCRELSKIKDPERRSQCLKAAAEKGKLTAKTLHQEYRRIVLEESVKRQPPELPKAGDVVRLSTKHNPDLNHLDKLWGVVQKRFEFTVSVKVLNAYVESISPYELSFFDDTDLDTSFAGALLDRLDAIFQHPDITPLGKTICSAICTQSYPLLDNLDNKILRTIEQNLGLKI